MPLAVDTAVAWGTETVADFESPEMTAGCKTELASLGISVGVEIGYLQGKVEVQ